MYSLKTTAVVIHLNTGIAVNGLHAILYNVLMREATVSMCLQSACVCSQHVSAVSMCLQVAIVPNTLSFNHVLAALLKAATRSCTPEERVTLAESGVNVFNQMLSRGRTPPDTSTYDTLTALLTHVGAAGQALHVHQLKLQQVGYGARTCATVWQHAGLFVVSL